MGSIVEPPAAGVTASLEAATGTVSSDPTAGGDNSGTGVPELVLDSLLMLTTGSPTNCAGVSRHDQGVVTVTDSNRTGSFGGPSDVWPLAGSTPAAATFFNTSKPLVILPKTE